MGVEPLIALPPRVLVAGRLQCGAARAGVRRGHGECAELAHLARGSSKLFTARHAENGPLSREVGANTILAQCPLCGARGGTGGRVCGGGRRRFVSTRIPLSWPRLYLD